MYLLDTNVISELRKGKKQQSQNVISWADSIPVNQCFLSAITIFELELGVQRLEYTNPPQGQTIRAWLTGLGPSYEGRILPFDEIAAKIAASLHIPNKQPERDAMIASIALKHGFTVVTRNTSDFERSGVSFINPFV
jgi:predicted nucleic acid-binding protein